MFGNSGGFWLSNLFHWFSLFILLLELVWFQNTYGNIRFSPQDTELPVLTSLRSYGPLLRHGLFTYRVKCEPRSDRQKPGPDGNSEQGGSVTMSNTSRQVKPRLSGKTLAGGRMADKANTRLSQG